MKKLFYLPSLFFMAAITLMSCRNETREADDLDDVNTTITEPETTMDEGFTQYDRNRDNRWDENEFSESYQGEFSGYDADTSGDLNNEEFTGATFRSVDRDRNNTINRQEWDEGYNNTFGDYANQDDFDRFDTDRSGDLSDTEWNQGFAESNWFGTYDEDQNQAVSGQEWSRANFSRWDRNNDGYLDEQEFQEYNRSMQGTGNMNSGNMNQNNSGNMDQNNSGNMNQNNSGNMNQNTGGQNQDPTGNQ